MLSVLPVVDCPPPCKAASNCPSRPASPSSRKPPVRLAAPAKRQIEYVKDLTAPPGGKNAGLPRAGALLRRHQNRLKRPLKRAPPAESFAPILPARVRKARTIFTFFQRVL